jgi:AcrR family transcriptional regulator
LPKSGDKPPSGEASAGAAPRSRAERRREDTRRRLMKATYEIIARRGLAGLVIQDITEAADVGYGSFYNHFASKDAIVDAVIEAARSHMRAIFRRLASITSDQAEIFALELRACLRLAKADETWGWFTIRTALSGDESGTGIARELKLSLDDCLKGGVFTGGDFEMAQEITDGLLLIGTLKLLTGAVGEAYPDKLVATILKHLGLPEARITFILSQPPPELDMPPFLEAAG